MKNLVVPKKHTYEIMWLPDRVENNPIMFKSTSGEGRLKMHFFKFKMHDTFSHSWHPCWLPQKNQVSMPTPSPLGCSKSQLF